MSNNLYVVREKDDTFTATIDSGIFDDDRMWRAFCMPLLPQDFKKLTDWMNLTYPVTVEYGKYPDNYASLIDLLKRVSVDLQTAIDTVCDGTQRDERSITALNLIRGCWAEIEKELEVKG